MVEWDKVKERVLLIRRFAHEDVLLYRLAKELGIDVASKYDKAYEEYLKYGYSFYMPLEERTILIEEIAKRISDEKLLDLFNQLRPRDILGIGFRGRYYVYEEGRGLRLENGWESVKKDVQEALEITKERGYAFLKALILLHKEGKWKGDYYGARYDEIIAKMREVLGETVFPAPRDFIVLRSYRIYYKSGSRKHPTHSIPEEIIPAVEEALEEWRCKDSGWKSGCN